MTIRTLAPLALACALACAACKPGAPGAQPAAPSSPAEPATGATPAAGPGIALPLKDVVETTPGYMLGITYPPGIAKYPGLARALADYAQAERARLTDAVARRGDAGDGLPYDMNLSFVLASESPELVVVRADGSRYTGGEQGDALLRRFVWLPARNELLEAARLIPDPAGWAAVAPVVREALATQMSERLDAEKLAPAEHAAAMTDLLQAIDRAVRPEASALAQFEPVTGPGGRIEALRFVFPPFHSDRFVDTEHGADVPAATLLPHVAAPYRPLFAGG